MRGQHGNITRFQLNYSVPNLTNKYVIFKLFLKSYFTSLRERLQSTTTFYLQSFWLEILLTWLQSRRNHAYNYR
uniref:Uncharacterized protein n=1 Tax=Solanum tuberosum TaxID=4113 RepID=M0ZIQ9_SOLTU